MAELTFAERDILKQAAYGAVALVSNAEPGLVDMAAESLAASQEMAGAREMVKEVLTSPGSVHLPTSRAKLEAHVVAQLRQSMAILRDRAPDEAAGYRSAVLDACRRAAMAREGVRPAEQTALGAIEAALGSDSAESESAAG